MIMENKNLSPYIFHNFDNSLSSHVFPKPLKYVDVTPKFKEDEEPFKKNYRRISIIPVISKSIKRFMYNQLYPYLKNVLSKMQCGLTKNGLTHKIEMWLKIDTNLLMKIFMLEFFWQNFRNHYGEDKTFLNLFCSYFTNWKWRPKENW